MNGMYRLFLPMLLAAFCSVTLAGQQPAKDLEIVNGDHWVAAELDEKRAYLFGVGNVLEIEQAMAGDSYAGMRGKSIVPVLLDGLSGMSIADIVAQLDQFYASHPDQTKRPVLEVLYLEMALPKMAR
jgi:hypothetical protein